MAGAGWAGGAVALQEDVVMWAGVSWAADRHRPFKAAANSIRCALFKDRETKRTKETKRTNNTAEGIERRIEMYRGIRVGNVRL